tara:strand:- start:629 stop:1027 length:399 start_codon:yes stop_codon:yes gene_type:complete
MQYTTKPFLVRYYETDKMGIVHHSNFLRYLEIARLEWLNKLGLDYSEIEKNGIILPVVDINVSYKQPARYGDTLKVQVFVKNKPKVTIDFEYKIINQSNKLICVAKTKICFLNEKTRKAIRCPENILNNFIT